MITPRDYKNEAFIQDMETRLKGGKVNFSCFSCTCLLLLLLQVLIFAERKATVDRIERLLRNKGIAALGIHGDKSQMQRDTTLRWAGNGEDNYLTKPCSGGSEKVHAR